VASTTTPHSHVSLNNNPYTCRHNAAPSNRGPDRGVWDDDHEVGLQVLAGAQHVRSFRLRIRAVERRILNGSGRRRMLSIVVDKSFLESGFARLSCVCRLTQQLFLTAKVPFCAMEAVTWSDFHYKPAARLPQLVVKEVARRDSITSSKTGDSGYNSDPEISPSPVDPLRESRHT
jgi:hypothetical protein